MSEANVVGKKVLESVLTGARRVNLKFRFAYRPLPIRHGVPELVLNSGEPKYPQGRVYQPELLKTRGTEVSPGGINCASDNTRLRPRG